MDHVTCAGCRYYRKGRCADWTVQALLGGNPMKDGLTRKCWEQMPAENEVDNDAESVKGAIK